MGWKGRRRKNVILTIIREHFRAKRMARNVLKEMTIPQAVHYLAGDEINRPGRKRAAQWAGKARAGR